MTSCRRRLNDAITLEDLHSYPTAQVDILGPVNLKSGWSGSHSGRATHCSFEGRSSSEPHGGGGEPDCIG